MDQKLFYEKNGFIIIRNNVDPVLLDKLCRRFIDICEGITDDYSAHIIKDPFLRKKGATGQNAVNKIQDCAYDDVIWEYASNKAVVDIVEQLIGPNITVSHCMIVNKPPNSDPDISRHPLHQLPKYNDSDSHAWRWDDKNASFLSTDELEIRMYDYRVMNLFGCDNLVQFGLNFLKDLHYSPCRPVDKSVTTWTAMEKSNERNGCLYVVPESHKGPLYNHDYPERGRRLAVYHEVKGMDHLPKLQVTMEKGDTIFFHPLLFHGSGPNLTQGFRKAISCHYVDSNCEMIDLTNTIQEKMAKEFEDIFEKRTGERKSYMNIVRAKSRLVRGSPGNLQLESHP